MGRDLYYTILKYTEQILNQHKKVLTWERIDHPKADNDYIYRVKRLDNLSDIVVIASDEYIYTLAHYFEKPQQIIEGSFILIARPESKYDDSLVEILQKDKISIGKSGALMGALYHEKHWDYTPKERRKDD